MGTPQDNPDGYREASVLPRTDQLEGRLLLIHGLIDENVHFRHSARFLDEVVKAGARIEVLPLPRERHGTRAPEARRYVATRSADFFRDALGEND